MNNHARDAMQLDMGLEYDKKLFVRKLSSGRQQELKMLRFDVDIGKFTISLMSYTDILPWYICCAERNKTRMSPHSNDIMRIMAYAQEEQRKTW